MTNLNRLFWLLLLALPACVSKPTGNPPVRHDWLPVGQGHQIYFEDAGSKSGVPAVYLHGGPGSGSNPNVRRFFDPNIYRVITYDQRGTGQSHYVDLLDHNTSTDLVNDLERLRVYLGIKKWIVVGGSWGSTLALVYAEKFPQSVRALVLWGIYLGTKDELPWLHAGKFPARWKSFSPRSTDPTSDYQAAMEDPASSEARRLELARRWRAYEKLIKDHSPTDAPLHLEPATPDLVRATRIKLAYLAHDSFLDHDILADIARIKALPGTIIQGDADPICPANGAARRLHFAWPQAEYIEVVGGEHSASDPRMATALTKALQKLASKQ